MSSSGAAEATARRAALLPLARAADRGAAAAARKTVRIVLALPESNEDTYPEFNYKEELAAAKKRSSVRKEKATSNGLGLDPFDDDSDVQRIAQEMEAKYGTGVTSKKKRKGRRDDYADIGMGYDESDSFIDNTDGYDEMIPQNVTTLHGGFYINCGALEFKTDDEVSSEISSSSSDDETIAPNKSAKRILQTSDDSEGERETEKSKNLEPLHKKMKMHNGTSTPKVFKKKLMSHDKMKHMKKKHSLESKRKQIDRGILSVEKREEPLVVFSSGLLTVEKLENENDKERENKKPMSMSTVTDTIESVVKGNNGNNNVISNEINKEVVNKDSAFSSRNTITLSSEGESSRDGRQDEVLIVKLPENLPNDILDLINSIKNSASRNTEGKVKFLSGPVGDLLLSLERKCKCLGKQSRLKVYEHLAPFVKCRKETLIKRAKNLVLEDDRKKIKEIMSKLKIIVENAMPTIMESYEREHQYALQKRLAGDVENNEELAKTLRIPRKRFPWTEESKKLVKEAVQLRKKCFLLEGKHKDSIDNLLEQYLKTELVVLWPEGWMSVAVLLKASGCASDPKQPATNNPPPENPGKKPPASSAMTNDLAKTSLLNSVKEIEQKFNNNPSLSITPVTTAGKSGGVSSNAVSMKSDVNVKISASEGAGASKSIKTLPPNIEITRTSPNSVHHHPQQSKHQEKVVKCDVVGEASGKDAKSGGRSHSVSIETIKPVKQNSTAEELLLLLDEYQQPQNLKVGKNSASGADKPDHQREKPAVVVGEANHYPVIDLTDHLDYKKKQSAYKSKTKSGEEAEKPSKARKEEITGSSALNQIITDTLGDVNLFAGGSGGGGLHSNLMKMKEAKHANSIFGASNEGEVIQKVIEELKNIHKMSSSPKKTAESASAGAPVSVIAFNKNYAPKTTYSQSSSSSSAAAAALSRNDYTKADFCSGFQDAFQKQLLGEHGGGLASMKSTTMGQTMPTAAASSASSSSTTKTNYNSVVVDKYPRMASGGGGGAQGSSIYAAGEKYLQNSNNNYTQPNTSKVKNNIPVQPGSYEMLNDMYSNFLSEYGFPKSGVQHKTKSQQK